VRRYGGRVRSIAGNPFCALFAAPSAPTVLSIAGATPDASGTRSITASFRVQGGRRLVTTNYPAPGLTVAAYRYAGSCPAGPPTGTPVSELSVPAGQLNQMQVDDRVALAPGRYCYALWTVDQAGQRSGGPTTAIVDVSRLGPTAGFVAPESAFVGAEVSFYDTSERGESRQIAGQWDFGDAGAPDNVSTEPDPTHTYTRAGTYTVTLTITNEIGQTSTTSRTVRIDP
jgi:PKD repeat protein